MIKKILFQLHWLLGISAGLVLALMGVTGASLSYQDELLRLFNPGVVSVVPAQDARALTPDELLGRLREQLPQRTVLGLTLSAAAAAAAAAADAAKVNVSGGGPRGETLYADPYSGELLGAARGAGLFQFMMQLHRWLAIGDAGKPITGAATLALLILCLSGLYLRWPRQAGNWRAWLTLDWRRSGRGFLWDLHAVAGTWVLLAYLLAALTGLYWSYEWYRNGVHALAGEPAPQHGGPGGRRGPPPQASAQAETPRAPVSIDPLWSAFRHAVQDDYRVANLRLPERAGQPLQVIYLPLAAEHGRAFNRLSLDTSGKLLQHERYADKSDVQQLLASVYPLHTGDYFGQAGRILMLLASLGMPLFFVTGWQLYLGRRRQRRAARAGRLPLDGASGNGQPWLIGFASQNGFAEQLAWRTAGQLQAAGATVQVRSLAQLDEQALRRAGRALFVVSTFGDGEAPDSARGFARRVLGGEFDLGHLEYALLGLGDRQYQRFCGFARQLHDWLQGQGARTLFAPLEVDNGDATTLQRWHAQLGGLTGSTPAVADEPGFAEWTLLARECLNPDSAAAPLWRLAFAVPAGQRWAAGDLVEIRPPQAGALPRSYSIASLAAEGVLELLVRLQRHADDSPGLCSGWLGEQLEVGATASLRLRRNSAFHLPEDDRPLLLIGNGSGLAGLRSLLRERAWRGQARNWLIFGERSAAHDFLCRDELLAWQAGDHLQRLDLAFSRDQAHKVYVQDRLREAASELQAWLADGAAIYVCGSRQGMGEGVERVLGELLGERQLAALRESGRYRRDLY